MTSALRWIPDQVRDDEGEGRTASHAVPAFRSHSGCIDGNRPVVDIRSAPHKAASVAFGKRVMQRKLTAQLAIQGGLEVISFQHCDCLVFERRETLKMLSPHSSRMLGGNAQYRRVAGDLIVIFEADLERLRPPSKRFKFGGFVTFMPTANFPSTITGSEIIEGEVDRNFFGKIRDLLNALPDSKSEWISKFGEDFFSRTLTDRCVDTVRDLRFCE